MKRDAKFSNLTIVCAKSDFGDDDIVTSLNCVCACVCARVSAVFGVCVRACVCVGTRKICRIQNRFYTKPVG